MSLYTCQLLARVSSFSYDSERTGPGADFPLVYGISLFLPYVLLVDGTVSLVVPRILTHLWQVYH